MSKKLVFLHIPKSSGTRQREILLDLYGSENCYWFGINTDSSATEITTDQLDAPLIIGGHKPIRFYPAELDAVYCSLVREPVSRVASLFRQYARPDLAKNKVPSRTLDSHQEWLNRGINPESIVDSIRHCTEFRRAIENGQCRFLSRYKVDFDGVLKTINENEFVLGTTECVVQFNAFLSEKLGWGEVPNRTINESKKNYQDIIFSEPGAVELIQELVSEDYKVYNYIKDECDGLLSKIQDETSFKSALQIQSAHPIDRFPPLPR